MMRRDSPAEIPYNRFFDFIETDADRYGILAGMLDSLGLNSTVLPIDGNRHFFIFPRGQSVKPGAGFPFSRQSPVILAAHYDRVAGSPGANDNSAAVFHLIKTAMRLTEQGTNYWIIILTDKEELLEGEGIQNQGSYTLAKKLREWGLGDARVYIFDACGAGDTFIISNTSDYLLRNDDRPGIRKAKQLNGDLRDYALQTARFLRLNRLLLIPTPFSDDAGFLRAGIPAQTITMLPAKEAAAYASLLRRRPEFADFLLAGAIEDPTDRRLIPETWRCLNGPADSHLLLTPENFAAVVRFAVALV
ncbi:MAG: M28 family peptidase [Treponema sp.]|jgi:hypothetical protein|nr:M28 family peptidase [Treponema sp.]